MDSYGAEIFTVERRIQNWTRPGKTRARKKMQKRKELIPLSGKWAEPAPVTVGGRARARARALSRKSKARNQPNLENFKGNLSFDQRGKLFSFSFSTKRAFRKYRSCPYRGERTTFWSSYLKTHQKIILFQIRSDDQNPRRETWGLISKLHVIVHVFNPKFCVLFNFQLFFKFLDAVNDFLKHLVTHKTFNCFKKGRFSHREKW